MSTSALLGYFWFNAVFFSTIWKRGVTKEDVQTSEDFLEQTNYDIYSNGYQLLDSVDMDNFNVVQFEQGFREGFQEKVRNNFIDRRDEYLEYWETGRELAPFQM